ncbi:MAG: hypothetical protein ACXVBP_03260 [Flavisolibacter sp.]
MKVLINQQAQVNQFDSASNGFYYEIIPPPKYPAIPERKKIRRKVDKTRQKIDSTRLLKSGINLLKEAPSYLGNYS